MQKILLNKIIGIFYLFFILQTGILAYANGQQPIESYTLTKNFLHYFENWEIHKSISYTKPWLIKDWEHSNSISNEDYSGLFYLKKEIKINGDVDNEIFYGLCGVTGSAYEIFWDSTLISKNGSPSTNKNLERPGDFFNPIIIDRSLITSGIHTIYIKASNFALDNKQLQPDFFIGDYNYLLATIYERQANVLFLIGICFITIILNIFMFYYSERKLHYLIFLSLCVLIILGLGIRFRWVFNDVTLTYSNFADTALLINIFLISVIFPLFFIFYFDIPKKIWLIFSIVIINGIVYLLNIDHYRAYAIISLLISFLSSLILIMWSVKLKRGGSLTSLIGIITIILLSTLFNKNGSDQQIMGGEGLIYTIIFFIAFFNFSIAREFSRKEKLLKEIELKSISLENELLRKQIQPHFLMNSLNSIIIWLKRDPSSAIKLIEALADEFRIISEVSGNKLIPIEQEIFLCESHLKIMSLRRDADFNLEIRGATKDILIPPMVLLTLVENGLTHGYENRNEGKFILTISKLSGKIIITLFNDSSDTGEPVLSEGTGIKYIKARLDQNFANSWSFDYKRVTDGWEVTIKLN